MGELMEISPIRDSDVKRIYDQVANMKAYKFASYWVPEHHPITLMHAHHKNSEKRREVMCAEVNGWVQKYCPNWEKRYGSYVRPPGKKKPKVRYAKWRPNYLAI